MRKSTKHRQNSIRENDIINAQPDRSTNSSCWYCVMENVYVLVPLHVRADHVDDGSPLVVCSAVVCRTASDTDTRWKCK